MLAKKDKKILVVASSAMGGSGIMAFRMAEGFAANGVTTYFLGFDKPFLITKDNTISKNLNILTVNVFKYQLFSFELKESSLVETIVDTVIKYGITEIHCHYAFVYGFAGLAAKNILKSVYNIEIKYVLICHGTDVIGYDPLNIGSKTFKHYNKYVLKNADIVVVASKALRDLIKEIYQIDREYTLIPNFIDTNKFRVLPNSKRDPFSIIHVSNFREVKKPKTIIDIFYNVLSKIPQATLTMVGEGPLMKETQKYAETLGIYPSVKFLGKIHEEAELVKILNSKLVYLHTSLFENASLACIEALACGVPVICSRVGGLPEIVEDGYNGFLVEKDDVDSFADKCIKILTEKELWSRLSKNAARSIHEKHFVRSDVTKKYLDLI
jgi:N-acetyl-alpha-D-glucosaminyl L-malate synthase BshA